ncbi:hypothetical protein J4Q44_G00001910 [Coregonus suidteri]|uniref:ATP-binding cassette sub-family B member 10, mitochondrial n=1 Tax=Coregonus suidteri TaxID=861788 RepID=A0AAN8MCF6_9TELE
MLDHRNTQSQGTDSSPAMVLMGRRTKTLLIMSENLLRQGMANCQLEKFEERQQKQAKYYDTSAKDLTELQRDDRVRVQPLTGQKHWWQRATVVRPVEQRSYEPVLHPWLLLIGLEMVWQEEDCRMVSTLPRMSLIRCWRTSRSSSAVQDLVLEHVCCDVEKHTVGVVLLPLDREVAAQAAVGFLVVSSAVTMSAPFFLGQVIDTIYSSSSEDFSASLCSLCFTLLGVFLCGGAARVYLMQISGQQIVRNLSVTLFSSILRQEFYVSPSLATFVLMIVPPMAGLAVIYGRYLRSISKRTQDSLAEATQLAEERISNMRTVRAFGKELTEVAKYTEKANYILHLAKQEAVLLAGFFGVTGLSGNIIIFSVLYKGGLLMATEHITVGELSSFHMYAFWVGISIAGMSSFYFELMKGFGAGARLWELLDRKPEFPLNEGIVLRPEQLKGNLEFQNVSFAYPTHKDAPIFQDLSLSVPAGSVMAVVGPSRSGKSTLVSLLLRLYDPDSGVITIDGHDVRDLNPYWLRSHIGTVSQEPVLFSCSIDENIAYGAPDSDTVTVQEIQQAAQIANAYEFVHGFPEGFDTVVGEKGVLLSGGQKQRIAIARALLKNPKILLLDEATSALDAENKFLVQEALERLMDGRTVLIIAHRLTTIQNADAPRLDWSSEWLNWGITCWGRQLSGSSWDRRPFKLNQPQL